MPYLQGAPIDTIPATDAAAETDPIIVLGSLKWRLPASGISSATGWNCPLFDSDSIVMPGAAGKSYDVELRFQGVVELQSYTGGTLLNNRFYVGGAPDTSSSPNSNVYSMSISSPAQKFFLNYGTDFTITVALDFTETIRIDAGATVGVFATSVDSLELQHTRSVAGVYDPSQPYPGQWVNVSVVSIRER